MPVTMKRGSKPKRKSVCWYHLPVEKWPRCPKCGTICTAQGTVVKDGRKTQNRKCPACGETTKTVIRE